MQAIQVNEYGGVEQLKVVEIPKPIAQRGQVLVPDPQHVAHHLERRERLRLAFVFP